MRGGGEGKGRVRNRFRARGGWGCRRARGSDLESEV